MGCVVMSCDLSPPGPQAVQELWLIMSDKLLEAIGLEPDADIVAIMVDSLCKVSQCVVSKTRLLVSSEAWVSLDIRLFVCLSVGPVSEFCHRLLL